MSDNLNTTSSIWFLGERQDFGSADWQRGRWFVDRIIERSTAEMADSVNMTTNSTWFEQLTVSSTTETHDVDLLPPITLQDSLGGVLCLGAVLLLVGLAIYALVRFRERKLAETTQSNAYEPTNWQQGRHNQSEEGRNHRDSRGLHRVAFQRASELPSAEELGDDDDVFYSSDNDETVPKKEQAALDLSSRVQAARTGAEASRKHSVEESRV